MLSEAAPVGVRGCTLIESLVAIALLGLAMSAMGRLLVTHVRAEGANLTQTTLIALAAAELEDLRAIEYADITTRSSTQTVAGVQYTVSTTVTAEKPAPNEKSIRTVVTRVGAPSYALDAIYTAIRR